jgi:microcystin-dependent protein
MPLESAQYISGLDAGNPSSTDSLAQADDHIRLIKSVLKTTFPNINGPVSTTDEQLSSPIPVGLIAMWSGVSVPSGWALCNGLNGTPNLSDRFIVAAGSTYPQNTTGGSLTSSAGGGHTHTEASAGGHNHTGVTGGTALTTSQMPSHTHTWSGTSTSEDNNYTAGSNWLREGSTVNNAAFTVTTTATGEGATHNHTIDTDGAHSHTINSVGDHTHTTTPPYYALAFIMKL